MPRDGSGNYTLPIGNPVVDGTVIQTTWANPTMSDIAAQLNNVLTRDGVLGALQPFRLIDGTAGAPALVFSAATTTGLYRPAANTLGFATGGSLRFSVSDTTLNFTGTRIIGDFSNATVASRVLFQTSVVNGGSVTGVIPNGTATSAHFRAYGSSDPTNATYVGMLGLGNTEARIEAGREGAGTYTPLTFYTNNAERLRIDVAGALTAVGALTVGSVAVTSSMVPTNGIYLSATNTLSFTTNGVIRGVFDSGGNLVVGTKVQSLSAGILGNFEAVGGVSSVWYNSGWRNDGSQVYLLSSAAQITQAAAQTATYNGFRPFTWNLASGQVAIDGSGQGMTIGSATSPSTVTELTVLNLNSGGPTWTRLVNGAGAASSTVNLSFDPGNNGTNNRDAYISASNSGANQISLSIYTSNAAAPFEALRVYPSGNVLVIKSTALIGYLGGGNVTQLTNKSTGVTLDINCGRVVMNGGSLAAGATVNFILTNNAITSSGDLLVLNVVAGVASVANYNVWCGFNTSGSVQIYVKNISAGALAEAVEIKFIVFRGSAV